MNILSMKPARRRHRPTTSDRNPGKSAYAHQDNSICVRPHSFVDPADCVFPSLLNNLWFTADFSITIDGNIGYTKLTMLRCNSEKQSRLVKENKDLNIGSILTCLYSVANPRESQR